MSQLCVYVSQVGITLFSNDIQCNMMESSSILLSFTLMEVLIMMYMYIVEVIRSLLDPTRTYRQLCSLAISSVFPSLGSRGNAAILRPTEVNCCKRMPFKDHQNTQVLNSTGNTYSHARLLNNVCF